MTLRTYRIGSRAVPDFDLLSLSVDYLRDLCQISHEAVHLAFPMEQGSYTFLKRWLQKM